MPAAQPEIAVAFIVREKFAWALASLKRLYALAGAPFTLYLVDGGYPPAVRAGLEAFLADKTNVVRIEVGRFLFPGEALNLVIERMRKCIYHFLICTTLYRLCTSIYDDSTDEARSGLRSVTSGDGNRRWC